MLDSKSFVHIFHTTQATRAAAELSFVRPISLRTSLKAYFLARLISV
jgi:hypothetical protein